MSSSRGYCEKWRVPGNVGMRKRNCAVWSARDLVEGVGVQRRRMKISSNVAARRIPPSPAPQPHIQLLARDAFWNLVLISRARPYCLSDSSALASSICIVENSSMGISRLRVRPPHWPRGMVGENDFFWMMGGGGRAYHFGCSAQGENPRSPREPLRRGHESTGINMKRMGSIGYTGIDSDNKCPSAAAICGQTSLPSQILDGGPNLIQPYYSAKKEIVRTTSRKGRMASFEQTPALCFLYSKREDNALNAANDEHSSALTRWLLLPDEPVPNFQQTIVWQTPTVDLPVRIGCLPVDLQSPPKS
ncbi:hypothetical protein BDK51DRAFT_32233 [Blyttiomyces helicus]|uniref:Uncharacterized protein n=1 Tax=Blyttiomyces helicus TaxID=388810 RepID=A0A4P9W0J4_9FUNG|nr:hypothetical protein BDK51DRAFT_32233 [Blyttiomyces helicus]|eukprot:RKO85661.1 hypothetical protein BDK51DRAFT_32233 [Blyttiomyces helicus]